MRYHGGRFATALWMAALGVLLGAWLYPGVAFGIVLHPYDWASTVTTGYTGLDTATTGMIDVPMANGKYYRLTNAPRVVQGLSNVSPWFINVGGVYGGKNVRQTASWGPNATNKADYMAPKWTAVVAWADGADMSSGYTAVSNLQGTGAGFLTMRGVQYSFGSGTNTGGGVNMTVGLQAGETTTAPVSYTTASPGSLGIYAFRVYQQAIGGRVLVNGSYRYWWRTRQMYCSRGTGISLAAWSTEATNSATPFGGFSGGTQTSTWSLSCSVYPWPQAESVTVFRHVAYPNADDVAGWGFTSTDNDLHDQLKAAWPTTTTIAAAVEPDTTDGGSSSSTSTAGTSTADAPGGWDLAGWSAKFDEIKAAVTSSVTGLLWPVTVIGGW